MHHRWDVPLTCAGTGRPDSSVMLTLGNSTVRVMMVVTVMIVVMLEMMLVMVVVMMLVMLRVMMIVMTMVAVILAADILLNTLCVLSFP